MLFDNTTTVENIKAAIFENMATDISRMEGGYTDTMVGAFALEMWKFWENQRLIPGCIAITKDSPPQIILDKCKAYGITQKPGKKATSAIMVYGTDGVLLAAGKRFLTDTGLEYASTQDEVIQDGQALVAVEAVAAGAKYNQPAGRILIQMESQQGVDRIENPSPAIGGADPESMESLVNRYHLYIQKPGTSANTNQYRQWAMEVEGVGDALITRLIAGPGTVGVTLASPELLPVDEATVQRCKQHIEALRPADAADVIVASGQGVAIRVSAEVTVAASTTPEEVAAKYRQLLQEYCRTTVALKQNELPLAKAGYLLMGIEGVDDYKDLQLNGSTANVVLTAGQLPVVEEVTLT